MLFFIPGWWTATSCTIVLESWLFSDVVVAGTTTSIAPRSVGRDALNFRRLRMVLKLESAVLVGAFFRLYGLRAEKGWERELLSYSALLIPSAIHVVPTSTVRSTRTLTELNPTQSLPKCPLKRSLAQKAFFPFYGRNIFFLQTDERAVGDVMFFV